MQNTICAEFLGTPVSILDHEGRLWLTARDVGVCLGYAEDHARHAILKLFTRHEDEFGPEDTGVVNLTTPGGEQQTRIFSQTGCVLLAMFAATPRAKNFRAWAKRALAGQSALPAARGGHLPTPRVTREKEFRALTLFADGMGYREIARELGISESVVSQLCTGKYRFAPGAGRDLTTPELLARVGQRHLARDLERLAQRYGVRHANQNLLAMIDQMGEKMLGRFYQMAGEDGQPLKLEG